MTTKPLNKSPKSGDWVLITNNTYEAFEEGYQGKWTIKHHQMVGKLMKVFSIESFHPGCDVIVCHIPNTPKEFLEFPSHCVKQIDVNIPEGWFPADMVPPRKEGKINIFIGITTKEHIPILVCWDDGTWINYYPLKDENTTANILAYQPILNWPKNMPKREPRS